MAKKKKTIVIAIIDTKYEKMWKMRSTKNRFCFESLLVNCMYISHKFRHPLLSILSESGWSMLIQREILNDTEIMME